MFQNHSPLFRVQRFGTAVLLLLASAAAILYIERGTFMDVAFQTFEIVRTHALAPQVYRFGSGTTQLFPLLAVWCKAPLHMVVFMYSLGIIIYQSGLFFYIAFIRKNAPIAIAFILYLCLASSHSFFWIQSEFSQSIPFGFACIAFLHGRTLASWHWVHVFIGIGLLTTAVFFHPLQGPLLWVFFFLLFFNKGNKKVMVIATLTVLAIGIIKQLFFSNWYDNMAAERLNLLSSNEPFTLLTKGMIQSVETGWDNYIVLLLAFLACMVGAWYYKKWLLLSVIGCFVVGYFLFIHWTHPNAESFYLDNLLLAIPAIVAYGLVLVFWQNSTTDFAPFQQLAASFVVLFFILRIVNVSDYYKQRIRLYHALIKQNGHQKMMLPANQLPRPFLLFAWPSAYEVWLHSTLQYGATASLLFIDDTSKYNPTYLPTKQFRGVRNYPYDSLLPPYFIWKDTLTSYQIK